MKGNKTFTMIKPKAISNGHLGPILAVINEAGFRVKALKLTKLSIEQAEAFYLIHKTKPFYQDLCLFMSSGPIVAAILEKDNAVDEYRELIGATNPEKAQDGTIRKLFATSMQQNAVHGSDSDDNVIIESDFFFAGVDRF